MRRGTVTEFDDDTGLGTVASDDGEHWPFHAIEIADGTRTIDVGRPVMFRPLPRFGRLQAGRIQKL
jgi:cold shock CspA family protein